MLAIRRRPLAVTLVLILSFAIVALALVASGHLLLSSVHAGAPPALADLLSLVDPAKLDGPLKTAGDALVKGALSGMAAAAMIGGLLLAARGDGDRERVAVDERLAAVMALALWYVVFNLFFPEPYGDEYMHQRAIAGIYRGDWDWTMALSMIPGYHYVVALVSEVTGPRLLVSRAVTLLTAVGMLLCYYRATKTWQGPDAGYATLALALLPILFPFSVAVYTDATSMLAVSAALWALAARRYNLSAAIMFVGCFVRQSNLVWTAFMAVLAAWELWKDWRPANRTARAPWRRFLIGECLPRLYGYGVSALAFLVYALTQMKGMIWGDVPMNRAHPNIAQLYAVCFFILLLWAPLWIERFGEDVRRLKEAAAGNRARARIVGLVLIAVAIVLVSTYDNAHPWNQYWYYLRNNPLMAMEGNLGLRVVGVAAVYWTVWATVQLWHGQPNRAELAIAAGFAALFLLPQALVEPRYFVLPFALINVFLRYSTAQQTRLLVWWSVLCAMICSAIVLGHLRYVFVAW